MPERKLSRRQFLIGATFIVGGAALGKVATACYPLGLKSEGPNYGEGLEEESKQVTVTNGGKSNLKGVSVYSACDLYANRDTSVDVSEHRIYAGTIDNGVTLLTEGQINCRVGRQGRKDLAERFYVVSQEEMARLVEAGLFHFPRGAIGSSKRLTKERYYLRSENIELPK